MNTGMNIGTVVNKESLEPLTDAIVRIAAGAPLHTAETREGAEAWRVAHLKGRE